jgi:hypothetical protein
MMRGIRDGGHANYGMSTGFSGRTVCPSTTKSCTMCVPRHDSVPWTTNVVPGVNQAEQSVGRGAAAGAIPNKWLTERRPVNAVVCTDEYRDDK